ncbi:Tetraspanin-7 [Echinococcus granulosus]|uniref:Tetraspanin-7 n=1 Tax=Echinococcus granulosus TaxID=6210 RepID=W6UJC1_ECHGR|nr:Tetraspanin-7 [Echinococcus granulosus]EUB61600.1 Tetraspanin-7 [Echinococcus granulosus]
MGCVISCGLKLILQVLNTVLCVAFLAVAVFGILLKSSKSIVQQLLSKIFDQFNIGDEDLRQLARFVTENADGIAITLVVVGLGLATLCFIGCIASCCGCNILLKIYAFILIVILVVEIIAVSVVFSDSTKLASLIVKEMETLLESFNGTSKEEKMSTAVWTVAMTGSTCCGMDGYGDFEKLNKSLPLQCCNMTAISCDSKTAQSVSVPGCRDKIVKFAADNMMTFMYISIAAILLEGALIVIVMLLIFL